MTARIVPSNGINIVDENDYNMVFIASEIVATALSHLIRNKIKHKNETAFKIGVMINELVQLMLTLKKRQYSKAALHLTLLKVYGDGLSKGDAYKIYQRLQHFHLDSFVFFY